MENKIQFTVGIFIYILFVLVACSFLIFQRGVWAYVDVAWWPKNWFENQYILKLLISSWKNYSFLGNPNFGMGFVRLPINTFIFFLSTLFNPDLSQILFYFFCYLLIYYGCVKLCHIFHIKSYFSKTVISCFYAFNPFAIHLISQPPIFCAYSAIPLFFFSLISFFKLEKARYLFINIFSFWLILFYPRISLQVIFFTLLIIFFFKEDVKKHTQLKKACLFSSFYIWLFSGCLFSLLFSKYIYSINYIPYVKSLHFEDFVHNLKNLSLLKYLILRYAYPSFPSTFYDSTIFLIFSLLFFVCLYLLLLSLKIHKSIFRSFWLTIAIYITLLIAGKFLPKALINVIYLKLIPFLAFNVRWIYVSLVIAVTGGMIYLFKTNLSKKAYIMLTITVFSYITISITPLLFYKQNYRLHKIQKSSIVSLLKTSKKFSFLRAMWYFPKNRENALLFKKFPYPCRFLNDSRIRVLFEGNPRMEELRELILYKKLIKDWNLLDNAFIFSLKDIFVFNSKVLQNPTKKFDSFPNLNYKEQAIKALFFLTRNSKMFLKDKTREYYHFTYKDCKSYDFFIYNPYKLILSDDLTILSKLDLHINERPLILNTSSSNALSSFKTLDTDVKIEIKVPLNNPTKYYIRVSNIDGSFLLHFNQTFSPYWKLFFINKEEYESIKPASKWEKFPLTNNKKCLYRDSLLGLENFKIAFTKTSLPDKYHLKGNFLGNTFLITNQSVPREYKNSKELYLVLLYKPQIYYTLALLNSAFVLTILCLISFMQEINNKE